MEHNRLNKPVFIWAYNKANTGMNSWIHAVRSRMNTSAMQHICVRQHLCTKSILLDFDVILYEYDLGKLKWFESLVKG